MRENQGHKPICLRGGGDNIISPFSGEVQCEKRRGDEKR